jgi:hypothetical protein
MKKIWKNKKKTVITLVLILGIAGVGSTTALLRAQAGSVNNTFTVGEVNTHIEEKTDEYSIAADTRMLKQPYIVNDGQNAAFVRARITVTPSDAGVILYAGTWKNQTGTLSPYETEQSGKTFDVKSTVYQDEQFANNGDWVYADDGWYYYTIVTSPEDDSEYHYTATLFDAVELQSNADVTIYQEAVSSGTYEAGKKVDVTTIQTYFDAADAAAETD